MTLPAIWELPTSRKGKVAYNDPETTLELVAAGYPDDTSLESAIEAWRSDTYTVRGQTRFFDSYQYTPHGNGNWTVSILYKKTPNTSELSVQPGGGTRKMFQSLSTVRSYSCLQAASETTTGAGEAAIAAAGTTETANDTLTALKDTAATSAAAALTAANVGGVDPTVKTDVITSVNASVAAYTYSIDFKAKIVELIAAVTAAGTAASQGNADSARTQADLAATLYSDADNLKDLMSAQVTACQDAADQATADATAGNAQTLAAAAAAETAATDLQALYTEVVAVLALALTAKNAANAAAEAVAADQEPGANGVPDFNRAIGVTDHSVEGVDVPDRKFEISFNKKFMRSAISGAYIMQLYGLLNKINDAPYTIVYNGQTLTFPAGSLLFLEFPFKMTSDQTLDITYKFGAQRPLLASENFTIGNSGVITKPTGWDYIWVYYKEQQDAASNRQVRKPVCAIVDRVFEEADYSLLLL